MFIILSETFSGGWTLKNASSFCCMSLEDPKSSFRHALVHFYPDLSVTYNNIWKASYFSEALRGGQTLKVLGCSKP